MGVLLPPTHIFGDPLLTPTYIFYFIPTPLQIKNGIALTDFSSYYKVLNEPRLELLKLSVQEEVERPMRCKMAAIAEESEQYRQELNKLKYEYSFLKSEYEHEKTEYARITEELKMRHEAETGNLRKGLLFSS